MESSKQLTGPLQLWKSAYQLYKKHINSIFLLLVFPAVVDFGSVVAGYGNEKLDVKTGGSGIISALYGLFLTAAIAYHLAGKEKTAPKLAWKKLWPILWTTILVTIMVILGFVALIIPGILLAVWSSQTTYAVIFENKTGLAAYRNSKELVKGRFWQVLGRLMFVILPIIPISIVGAIQLPGAIAASLLTTLVYVPIVLIYEYLLYRALSETA